MIGGPNPMLGNRQSQHKFSQIPAVNMARSQFDRSFAMKTTFDFDSLYPIFVDEVIPGDTSNLTVNTFVRLSTQYVPVMDNMYVDYFFFFVPNRLVWTHWEKFCGSQDNPGDSTSYVIPTVTSTAVTGFVNGTLYDHLGLPPGVPGFVINNLPARAYNLIWNTWFRDENLQNSVTGVNYAVDMGDGPDTLANYVLLKRGKRHDYFTSCLPFLQKGAAVTIPSGNSAMVKVLNPVTAPTLGRITSTNALTAFNGGIALGHVGADGVLVDVTDTVPYTLDPNGQWYADLTTATATTINQLRQAFQMQSLFELDARGGTRYVEILQNHYQVVSPDFRLQRPEFLGGGSQKISSHPVPQTSSTSGSNYQGNLSAFGTSSSNGGIGFTKSFVEHGYVIGLACPRADLTYQQGVERMYSKSTRYDFFWPKLQELGEQAVLNQEIYAVGSANPTQDAAVFGYQERYGEYRFKLSQVHGQFRSTYSTPIDYYHLAQEFLALPALNSTFISQSTPIARVIYDDVAPSLLGDFWFNYKQARPMTTYGVPVALGRF